VLFIVLLFVNWYSAGAQVSTPLGNVSVEGNFGAWDGQGFLGTIANPGTTRGRVLEIAYGYTTEDDTLRLQDDYGRPLEPDW